MLETFVDSHYHTGTIYRADNWTMLGHTRGYRRISGGYSAVPVESVKLVFVKPLRRDTRRILCAPQLPHFESIRNFRQAQGRRHHLPTMLALVAVVILSGARGYKEIHLWCDELSQANRSHFRCRKRRNRREIPSVTVIRRVMMEITPAVLQSHINAFCAEHFGTAQEAIAVDDKVLRGWGDADRARFM